MGMRSLGFCKKKYWLRFVLCVCAEILPFQSNRYFSKFFFHNIFESKPPQRTHRTFVSTFHKATVVQTLKPIVISRKSKLSKLIKDDIQIFTKVPAKYTTNNLPIIIIWFVVPDSLSLIFWSAVSAINIGVATAVCYKYLNKYFSTVIGKHTEVDVWKICVLKMLSLK